MDGFQVKLEYAPCHPDWEVERRLRKVYDLLSRPAPPSAADELPSPLAEPAWSGEGSEAPVCGGA
jgi:hypothetical protein